MIRKTSPEDRTPLLTLLQESGKFDADGLEHVAETLDAYLSSPGEEIWYTAVEEGTPVGVAYCRPEPVTLGTWNLLMIWMKKGVEGKGFGSALMSSIFDELQDRKARLLIVETTQGEEFAGARAFYEKIGFTLEGQVNDFYDEGAHKLMYTKRVTDPRA